MDLHKAKKQLECEALLGISISNSNLGQLQCIILRQLWLFRLYCISWNVLNEPFWIKINNYELGKNDSTVPRTCIH